MMRDCENLGALLAPYAAGELAEPECTALTVHLDGCGACRAELAREQDLRRLLGGLPPVRCPDAVTRSLLRTLPRDDRGTAVRAPRRRRAWAAGAALVAASLATALLAPGLRPHSPPAVPSYTAAEVAQARRDVQAVLALTANVLDRSRDRTLSDVFGARLPAAVSGSLRPLDADAHNPNPAPSAVDNGGQG